MGKGGAVVRKSSSRTRFAVEFDHVYGTHARLLSLAGLMRGRGDEVVLSDSGAFWLHALQDLFSIDYVSKLWGTSRVDPWPTRVAL